ncbi:hypothetical protein, partial [Pseudomonas aeruginosa]|uniref:hypothetical protein n=1 Tax=Pseudomonas aeruginosa TaxID=287 RepID=UPI001C0EABF7
LDVLSPGLAPRVHRFHMNPLLEKAQDAGRGVRAKGGRAGRLPSKAVSSHPKAAEAALRLSLRNG